MSNLEDDVFLNDGLTSHPWHLPKVIPPAEPDVINHPAHYNSHPSGIECIVVAEHHNFNIGSVLKYIWRCGLKSGATDIEDLKKAEWYIGREIKRLEALRKDSQ